MCPACVRALFLVELCSMTCVSMCPAVFGGRVLDVSRMCPLYVSWKAGRGKVILSTYVNRFFGSLLKTFSVAFRFYTDKPALAKAFMKLFFADAAFQWLWCGGLNNYAQPGFGRGKQYERAAAYAKVNSKTASPASFCNKNIIIMEKRAAPTSWSRVLQNIKIHGTPHNSEKSFRNLKRLDLNTILG